MKVGSLPASSLRRFPRFRPFREWNRDFTLLAIADRHLANVIERLIASGALPGPSIELRDRVRAAVTSSQFGARTIERTVEDQVSAWLDQQVAQADEIAPGSVVLDRIRSRPRVTAALLVVAGSDVGAVIAALRSGPGAADLLYLKHAGVGALAIFGGLPAARRAATVIGGPATLHWGRVDRVGDNLRGAAIDEVMALARKAGDGLTVSDAAASMTDR